MNLFVKQLVRRMESINMHLWSDFVKKKLGIRSNNYPKTCRRRNVTVGVLEKSKEKF